MTKLLKEEEVTPEVAQKVTDSLNT